MSPTRLACGFIVRVVALYVFFIAPWPGVEDGYGAAFAGVADWLAPNDLERDGLIGTGRFIRVYHEPDPQRDLRVVVFNKKNKGGTDLPNVTSSRHLGFMPTVALAALILATPVAWPRRLMALVWGLLVAHVFIALRCALVLAYLLHGDRAYSLFQLEGTARQAFVYAYDILTVEPGTTYVVPVFIWVLVTFRRSDLDRFISRFSREGSEAAGDQKKGRAAPVHDQRQTTADQHE